MEVAGFEPATPWLQTKCSTAELHPRGAVQAIPARLLPCDSTTWIPSLEDGPPSRTIKLGARARIFSQEPDRVVSRQSIGRHVPGRGRIVGKLGRLSAAVLVPITMMVLSAQPDAARLQEGTPVVLLARLERIEGGGANVTFDVRNDGPRVLSIKDDFHLFLEAVRPNGTRLVSIAFVFPAPEFEVVPPGEARTFVLPKVVGDDGEPGVDFGGGAYSFTRRRSRASGETGHRSLRVPWVSGP